MKLRGFLNAGFALLVESYMSAGMHVVEATQHVWDALGISPDEEKHENIEAQNAASLAQLENMMRGVK